jgi:predicted negative regulator of RcsB-dependent stress response
MALDSHIMALKHLDLEEQEQLDKLKAFWKQFGSLISAALILVCGSIAAYNGYQWWQRDKSAQAAAMYDEVERAAKGRDPAKINRAFADMKERFGGTTYAAQAGLLSAKALYDTGQASQAKVPLQWVASSAADESYRAIAKLRLSSLLFEDKAFDEALKLLETLPAEFEALAADRRGDILLAQGKRDEAQRAFDKAYKAMDERSEYRRLVQVKLNALGVDTRTNSAANSATNDAAAAQPSAADTPPAAPAASASK